MDTITSTITELVEKYLPSNSSSSQFSPLIRNAVAVVGVSYLLKLAIEHGLALFSGFRAYFLSPRGIGGTNFRKYGPWAVVTGASEGIGRGYALELARQGLNVVIMSRSREKLQKVADEITALYGKEVRIVVVDFSEGQEIYPRIADQLKDLDIGILVNNVGLSYLHPEYFLEVPTSRHRNIIEINCQAMVQMTYLFLPQMIEKKRGIIVNVSSISDVMALPFLATYAGSKSFVRFFSDSLRAEYKSKGIIVQCVAAGMVTTEMSNARKVTFSTPDPNTYAKSAVATIGIQDYTHGYFGHALQQYNRLIFPDFVYHYYGSRFMRRSRERLLYRKAQGTLVSQLKQKNVM